VDTTCVIRRGLLQEVLQQVQKLFMTKNMATSWTRRFQVFKAEDPSGLKVPEEQ
jgi:hypothetical protein